MRRRSSPASALTSSRLRNRESGDPGRYAWYSREAGLSSFFEAHNHGKRSIALDLKHPRGRDVFLRLAAHSDVLLHNFRIGAVERLGLDYESVAKANPRIVYVQASAYGPAGDERDAGAFDYVAQARSGFASTNGEPDDPPLPSVVAIGDQSGALHACIAALAGLAGRAATGRGGKYDTSLLGSMLALQSFDIDNYLFTGRLRERFYNGGARPFWRVYRGGDGRWFVIGMLLDRAWPQVCEVIGRPDIASDERFATYRSRMFENAPALMAILEEAFLASPASIWVERLMPSACSPRLCRTTPKSRVIRRSIANALHPGRRALGRRSRSHGQRRHHHQ